jgi:hypothetical protein
MILIALAASLSPQFEYLLRFGALALATLTLLGALSDMQRAARNAHGMLREDLLKLWFGGKLREQHTWENLNAQVSQTASAFRLPPPPAPASLPPDPITNGARSSGSTRSIGPTRKKPAADQAKTTEASEQIMPQQPRPALGPTLRLLGLEALSEAIVIAAIALNWFLPAPGTSEGEQTALLILGVLALGLLWFDWRLTRRFVAAMQAELARLAPQSSTRATSSS